MFEGFRRRTEPKNSPWPEKLLPATTPIDPPDLLDQGVYHVPQRSAGGGSLPPSWSGPDLDPQRLDGRSPPMPTAESRLRPPETVERDAEQVLRDALTDFLNNRAARPSAAARAGRPAAKPPPARAPTVRPETAPRWPTVWPETLLRGPTVQPETPPHGPTARPETPPHGPAARPAPDVETRTAPAERTSATVPVTTDDPRISLLHQARSPATVDSPGLDVATRPRRSYPVRWPDTSRETRVRPEYHGVGVRPATAHPPGRMRTRGLGLMFPPHTVHARDSTSAVVTVDCDLALVDHVHIRQAVVARDDALRSGPVKEIVARARTGRDADQVVHDLRRALSDPIARAELRADCAPSVHQAETVRLGDDAMTCLDSRYVVERTIVPVGALLAGSEDLARRYLAVVAGPADDPGALAAFLGDLVGAAENATDDNVLGYADGLPDQRAAVLGLFGMATVDYATSVIIRAHRPPDD